MSTTKTDPGSYTICDEPFDVYGATYVPLRTPHGPVTLTFISGDIVRVAAGYQRYEYDRGEANLSGGEAFIWANREVCGDVFLYRYGSAWSTKPYPEHIEGVSLYGRGGNVTDRMTAGTVAYWTEVVRRYAAEHPHILAHAAFRSAVTELTRQGEKIAEAEQALRELRAVRTQARRAVRQALIAEHRTTENGLDCPRPYYNETVNGYVVELMNDPVFVTAIGGKL